MSWSTAEVMALAQKAARGGGAPAGQAARFGSVAALHLGKARSTDDLARALDALPEGPILTYPLALDAALGQCTAGTGAVHLSKPVDTLMHSYADALPFWADLTSAGKLTLDVTAPKTPASLNRITGCDDLIERMTQLAERTYVPESDSSRTSGAGAGVLDND
ncbi:MAG: hypothetical protein AB8B62_18185 [Roseobacter sp.]